MKITLSFILFSFMFSCQEKTDLAQLKSFDTSIRSFEQIRQIGPHHINDVLFGDHLKLDTIDAKLSSGLDSIRLTKSDYKTLKGEMNSLGLSGYVRMEKYSIYFTRGSFARMFGFLVSHSKQDFADSQMLVNGRYDINVGKEIIRGIYPIWTD